MRRKTLRSVLSVLFVALFSSLNLGVKAQTITTGDGRFEIGLGFGPMFFLGDLGGQAGIGKDFVRDVDLPLTKVSKNLMASYYPAEFLGFRLALNHGVLSGNDNEAPDKGGAEEDRRLRNLSFKTNVLEAYVAAELYPTVFMEKYDGLLHKFRPYGVIGAGMIKYNPKAKLGNEWVALHPLRLEGQGMAEYPDVKPYKLIQSEILMGFGFKYYIRDNMYVGLELLHRQMFTDYIDDVSTGYVDPIVFDSYLSASDAAKAKQLYYRGNYGAQYGSPQSNPGLIQTYQRGDPTDNDAWFSTIIRVGWRLNDAGQKLSRRQLRCPVFY